jgi:periplasmic divalent cation tolerance protein
MKTDAILVFCTVPDPVTARNIADDLLTQKLAACVSLLPGLESHYIWLGKKEISQEILLMIKTQGSLYSDLEVRLRGLHPYECPEIIAIPIEHGFADYLSWIKQSCRPTSRQ